jgi:hypothetical protein
MPVGTLMVVVLKAFVEHCVSLVLGHPFEFSRLEISQTDVFHQFSSSWWEPAAQRRKNREQRRTFLEKLGNVSSVPDFPVPDFPKHLTTSIV